MTTSLAHAFALASLASLASLTSLASVGCSSSSSSTTDDAGGDSGDPRARAAALARDDLPCKTDADCCVVFDHCRNDGYVVAAKDEAVATALLASADPTMCTACIAPSTQVTCAPSGFCTGATISCSGSFFSDASKDHCGALALPAGCTVTPASSAGAPASATKTIMHCG